MAEIEAMARKVGGSIGVLLPADLVRTEGIKEGDRLKLDVVREEVPDPLGLLKGKVPYEPFIRAKERFWKDE